MLPSFINLHNLAWLHLLGNELLYLLSKSTKDLTQQLHDKGTGHPYCLCL